MQSWAWCYKNCCTFWSLHCHCIGTDDYEVRTWLHYTSMVYAVFNCLYVSPSYTGIVSKWLNVGICKQCYTIDQGFLVPMYNRNGKSEWECVTFIATLIVQQWAWYDLQRCDRSGHKILVGLNVFKMHLRWMQCVPLMCGDACCHTVRPSFPFYVFAF